MKTKRKASRTPIKTETPAESVPAFDFDALGGALAESLTRQEVATTLRCSESTLLRWEADGLPGRDGRTHRLKTVRVARRTYIQKAALSEFLAAVSSRS